MTSRASRLAHAVHGDLLHDHVAAAHGGHHRLGLDAGLGHETLDGLGHDAGVHDLALDDGVMADRRERHLGQDRTTGGVRDRDELDQAASDVQPDRRRLAPEESHNVRWLRRRSRYLGVQWATDVPHKLHIGNPLQAKQLNPGPDEQPTADSPALHLLFRKPSLGMQQSARSRVTCNIWQCNIWSALGVVRSIELDPASLTQPRYSCRADAPPSGVA